ncbi:HNH endonuclease [Streptomyces phage Wofford]|uniref:HNH endonuclease n=1 Tax=Streptomyces phage Wofford TaxID=2283267 RepID=A0A345M9W0_9CAUD|nr:HNH endonuclease [Streptomyces phage Wollford]AXH67281.1 HNH endonuclease [Streptomyces phage Wollford]
MAILKPNRKEIVRALTDRDGLICQYPGCVLPFTKDNGPTIDHWFPLSAGGTWDLENLKLMHKKCNAAKGDKIPLDDGTLPVVERKPRVNRALKRAERPVICESCQSGRLLGPDEECAKCGSGPMPPTYPQWAKVKPNECPHEGIWWCWCCMSGIIERVPASKYVFNDGEPGID